MGYTVKYTSQFKRDVKKAKKQGKDMDHLFAVIEQLAAGLSLPERYRDHALAGNFKGCRECHIEPDWLLIYEYVEDVLVLSLTRLGSHAELFKM